MGKCGCAVQWLTTGQPYLNVMAKPGIIPSVAAQGLGTTPSYYPLPALDPASGGTKKVRLMTDLADQVLRYGPRQRYHEIVGDRQDPTTGSPVQQILTKPAAVFGGVCEHQQGGVCYTGLPSCAYTNSGSKVPPFPEKVFCVYVNPQDKVYEWGWEQADPDTVGLPLGYQDTKRFKEQLWPRQ